MKILASLLSILTAQGASAYTITLTPANTVLFRGEVDGNSTIKAQLKLVDKVVQRGKAQYPIYLVLDSPGGSIYAGQSFIEFAKTLQNVHTVSIFAASMAAGFVEALPGRRYITENGILMFHRAKGSFEGQFEEGEVESQLQLWKEIVLQMESKNANRVGLSLQAYKAKVANEWWMTGPSAVRQKAADEVVDIVCNKALIDERETLDEIIFIFRVKRTYSGCPLFRSALKTESGDE